ncbi:hypothetical protein C8R43DRAFT_1190280 [Mycena crocata]|nr:hypothetical protein C8R43DRAFT_1190280 [Mycena crocata]
MSPRISGYVGDLTICLEAGPDYTLTSNVLQVVHNLTGLVMQFHPLTHWSDLPDAFTSSLRDHRSSKKCLCSHGVHQDVTDDKPFIPRLREAPDSSRLKNLTLHSPYEEATGKFVVDIYLHLRLNALRKLVLEIGREGDLEHRRRLMDEAAFYATLEHLEFRFSVFRHLPSSLDVPVLPALRVLQLLFASTNRIPPLESVLE